MEDGIPGRLQHHYKMCCEKGWLPWKAGLYDLGVVSPWGCYFWTDKLAYDTITALLDCSHVLIISDVGIKNNVAISIAHIYVQNRPIIKTIHHTTNITSTKAKLFAIRYKLSIYLVY